MITEWFITTANSVMTWFVGLWPAGGTAPAWLTGVSGYIQNVINSGAGLSPWIPWPLIATVAGFQVGTWFVLWIVKVVRWLIGLIPTMGGG